HDLYLSEPPRLPSIGIGRNSTQRTSSGKAVCCGLTRRQAKSCVTSNLCIMNAIHQSSYFSASSRIRQQRLCEETQTNGARSPSIICTSYQLEPRRKSPEPGTRGVPNCRQSNSRPRAVEPDRKRLCF